MKYICKVCKKEFEKAPSQLRGGTCSKECGYKIRVIGVNSGQFKKGNKPWLTGKKTPQWLKDKMSESHQKTKKGKGKLHWHWKGGKRRYYSDMARKILLKNNIKAKCAICKEKEKRIHTHHLDKNWKNNKLDNLIFVCISCHLKIHHKEDRTKNICIWCSKTFYSGRKSRKHCSTKCHGLFWRYKKYKND